MDTLSIFKFWKPTKTKIAVTTISSSDGDSDTIVSDQITDFSEDDDDEDSFFELELTLPKFNPPKPSQKPVLKPQSPISILRSASPNLNIFTFGKKQKTDSNNFTVKFRIEDGSIVPKFENDELVLKNKNESKRFLSFSFGKMRRKCEEERRVSASSETGMYNHTFPSPMKEKISRFKGRKKELGKSKSGSAIVVLPRHDYACDGIESAILHCKRSLDSNSRGNSALSRCSSDPSHEKSITLSEDQL